MHEPARSTPVTPMRLDLRRTREYSSQPREITTDAETLAANFRQHFENRLIGDIIADENRDATGKGRMRHQLANARAFVDTRPLDFEYRLSQEQFGRFGGKLLARCGHVMPQAFGILRRLAIVQRQRIVFVFNDDIGTDIASVGKAPAKVLRQRLRPIESLTIAQAHLRTMSAD